MRGREWRLPMGKICCSGLDWLVTKGCYVMKGGGLVFIIHSSKRFK